MQRFAHIALCFLTFLPLSPDKFGSGSFARSVFIQVVQPMSYFRANQFPAITGAQPSLKCSKPNSRVLAMSGLVEGSNSFLPLEEYHVLLGFGYSASAKSTKQVAMDVHHVPLFPRCHATHVLFNSCQVSNHRSTNTSLIRFNAKAEWSIRYIRPTGSQ